MSTFKKDEEFASGLTWWPMTLQLVRTGSGWILVTVDSSYFILIDNTQAHRQTDRQTDRPTYLPTYVPNLPTYVRTYIRTYVHTYVRTYMIIYIYIYAHIYIYIIIHIYICAYIYILNIYIYVFLIYIYICTQRRKHVCDNNNARLCPKQPDLMIQYNVQLVSVFSSERLQRDDGLATTVWESIVFSSNICMQYPLVI